MRVVVAIVVLLLGVWSGVWAFAELLTIPPRNLMDKAVKDKNFPVDYNWQPMREAMSAAAALKPWDADIQLELGRMAGWQAAAYPLGDKDRMAHLQSAVTHLKRAVTLRPTWGLGWAQLAYAQIQIGDVAKTGAPQSLALAMQFSPYDDYVQRLVLWSGFAMWDILPDDTRTKVVHVAEHAAKNLRHRWVVDYAVQFHREKHVAHLATEGSPFARRLKNQVMIRDKRRQSVGL